MSAQGSSSEGESAPDASSATAGSEPSRCVILVPVGGHIEPGCEEGLRTLEARGYAVWRVRGYADISAARSQMATDALAKGYDEMMWIDSDVVFRPDDIERLRSHRLPFVCGVYAKKGRRQFACSFLPGAEKITYGKAGGLCELLYGGFGFVHTRRILYETIRNRLELPTCNTRFKSPLLPFFMPMVVSHDDASWYLGEDYAFCERARQCGFKIMADTRIRLFHVGSYPFGWEDAGKDPDRFGTYTFHLMGKPPTPTVQTEPTLGPDDLSSSSESKPLPEAAS